MQRRICFLLIWLLVAPVVYAQVPARAQRFFNLAMTYEGRKEHDRARKKMEEALKLYPAFTIAYSILGEWYFEDHQFDKSADVFQRAYTHTPNGNKLFSFPLAKSLVYAGRPEEALQVIANANVQTKEWLKLKETAQFMTTARNHAWKDTVFNLGRTNTADAEMFPYISHDEQKVYFTRRRNGIDEDFYYAVKDSCGGWFKAKNMGSPPNTPDQEAAQMISSDGHYLFFMKCENRAENGWESGGCDLYMSYTADSIWSAPQSFGGTVNSPAFEGMPCLSPDNRELYFVSNRPGGYGGMDIWVARFERGLWQQPRNLGPDVNTTGDETAPFLHADNYTLYFASTGHQGFGGTDLFMARRRNDSTFHKPINMGAPVNTVADENSLCINFKGDKIYFSSDREKKGGDFDLYEMKLPEALRPKPIVAIRGYTYDSLGRQRLPSSGIFVKGAITGEPSYQFVANRGDASFMITLPAGKYYDWKTDRFSYMASEASVDLTNTQPGSTIEYNIALLPDDYVAPINDSLIATIRFPRNSAKLTDQDKAKLQQAMAYWLTDSKGAMIFVGGFTDDSGTPLINEELSYQRAGLVTQELISLGWQEMSIQTKGWGEANPIAPNDTEENMGLNRRVEVVIRR